MRIDIQQAYLGAPTERIRTEPPAAGKATRASGDSQGLDSVALSSDLRLADAAIRAVRSAGDNRAEEVARAKALLERGELGRDLEGLADAIISDALNES